MLLFLSCQNHQTVKQVKGGTITIQEYDTPPSEVAMRLSEEDSLLYHEVVADYGNYWETTTGTKLKEWHLIAIQELYCFMKMIKMYLLIKAILI